jgi:hypothetical protein
MSGKGRREVVECCGRMGLEGVMVQMCVRPVGGKLGEIFVVGVMMRGSDAALAQYSVELLQGSWVEGKRLVAACKLRHSEKSTSRVGVRNTHHLLHVGTVFAHGCPARHVVRIIASDNDTLLGALLGYPDCTLHVLTLRCRHAIETVCRRGGGLLVGRYKHRQHSGRKTF